ncbi:hypothetical protein HG536_0F00640 [Torulaspora globosa]|uniref:Zn(2)-C6 fungal-type domain-containing protein n=1 Tax=Torulaspora globosa TaxID=48254 RepID=A0A7G3ZJQ3_9SACH|nr:uncharacterized protein HG536_0F00640 [Torulaspora globosa]QLL33739.1 hypothetical protein HG536_0F00640 [Torulaspora globosa]
MSTSQSESDQSVFEGNGATRRISSAVGGIGRKKFACVECRQQKSKCDAHERAPKPCTKCAKKGVPCILKKDFRRTYKRARNEAIEKRFKELTRTLTNLSSEEILKRIEQEQQALLNGQNFTKEKVKHLKRTVPSESSALYAVSPLVIEGSSNDDAAFADRSNAEAAAPSDVLTEEQLKCSPKSLGDIHMSSRDIAELFQEFVTKYHPFLPVVDISKGAERIYTLSPCLFWVILLIGLRRRFGATDLMIRLSSLVKSILAEITISPIIRYTPSEADEPVLNVASVYSVQAFLLYTFWPPLTSSLSADTSWNTIGTAMFQAIRVGLNCAEFSKEYATANSELINEQVRTWVCCNVVSQIIASSFGFPAYVSFDHTVVNAARENQDSHKHHRMPSAIKQMAQIAHFEYQVISTMNSNPASELGMVASEQKQPLLQVLNQQLTQLEANLRDSKMDSIGKFLLLVAKVHLLTYYFTDSLSSLKKDFTDVRLMSLSEIESNFETKRGLVRVYNAAIDLLNHSTSMWQRDPTIIKYFPGVFVLNIWQSACIISKLAHSSLSAVLDRDRGKKAYQDAISLTFNASVLKHDMAYRSSAIMRSIWSMFANMHADWQKGKDSREEKVASDFNLGISIKSRMSVSVFFDSLSILREKCGMAKVRREAVNDEDYEEDDDEDEPLRRSEEHDSAPTRTSSRERRLSTVRHPEESARKIIKTIPLDPNPINAAHGSPGSSLTSPSSQATEVLSLNGILSNRSPRDRLDSSLFTGPDTTASHALEPRGGPPVPSLFSPPQHSTETAQDGPDNQAFDDQAPPKQDDDTLPQSPPFLMEHWDNWESDSVWKDVDILMNEFAFNPTV